MPRLSLYRPEKGKDYKFLDKNIEEMFTIGGTDVFVHKYLGPKNPAEGTATAGTPTYDAVKETNIQDMLFMENRDRKYDPDIYTMRGIYNVSDVDLTIEDSSVTNSMLGGSIAIGKIDFLDTSAALGTSNDVVPSQAAVKSYVDAAVSSGGLTDLEVGDMQMVHNFTKIGKN